MKDKAALWILGGLFLLGMAKRQNGAFIAGRIQKIRYIPVYKELPTDGRPGKLNIGFAKGKSGVYLIKEDGVIVYVGQSSSDLYTTISRHFQQWIDNGRERITYDSNLHRYRYTVRIVFVSPTRALRLEEALIRKHRPRDNSFKLHQIELYPAEEMKQQEILQEYEDTWTDVVAPF